MPKIKRILAAIVPLAMLSVALPAPARAETIAVIGTGNVGGALGPEFAALGHTIIYGSREPGPSISSRVNVKTRSLPSI